MKISPTKPSQPRFVAMNGRAYAWDAVGGLDPAVALEVEGFIRMKAWQLRSRAAMAGLEFDDLVQEGWTGALKAAAKFNPEFGANYLGYASKWIEAAMKEALRHPIVRTPEGEAFAHVHSLDAPLASNGQQDGLTLMDCQRDDRPSAHELSAGAEDRARVRKALPKLSAAGRVLLVRHLGLDGHEPQPLQVVASELGLTRHRAAVILARAQQDLQQALKGRGA